VTKERVFLDCPEDSAPEWHAMIVRRTVPTSTQHRQSAAPGRLSSLLLLASIFACVGCQRSSKEVQSGEPPMSIEVTSTAFQQGTSIPKKYTSDGADVSPPLRWSDPPAGTKSFTLIVDDPDAPRGIWVHWVLYSLPAQTRELEEGVPTIPTLPSGAKQGKNDFGNIGYGGPAPPKGKAHRYFFKLYALEVAVDLPVGSTKAEVEHAMKGRILAQGQLMGTYQR
jgi:Raf kinase inhibitor-like YbhB/YbcL family protein